MSLSSGAGDYRLTIRCCYLGMFVQAIVINLAPVLFIPFREQLGLTFEQLGRLILVNFVTQVAFDLIAAVVVNRIGARRLVAGAHVAVTGATSGLGHATARQLSALGAHVHLIVRDAGKAEVVAAGLGGPASVWVCDLSDRDSVRRCAGEIGAAGPPLAGLVHNAGALPPARAEP